MGLFDRSHSKSHADHVQEEMRRLAPILFPGGEEEIKAAGRTISAMLDSRIPTDAAGRLFASARYLAHTAGDRSQQRIVEYIVRQGMGRVSEDEATAIYGRFIAGAQNPASARGAPQKASKVMCVDASLAGHEYRLQNSFRTVRIDASVFTVLMLGLRENGWRGAAHLFAPDGTMKPLTGSHTISEQDARGVAAMLEQLVRSRGLEPEVEATVRLLISIASRGAFTLHT